MGDIDLTPYSPRLLLQWDEQAPGARHRTIDGTLVFADVSGFTRLSERLARSKGKAGAEEMTETIGFLFGELLTVAAARGGEMLKYGGDAVLLFFRGEGHAPRAAAAAIEMQRRLGEIGRIETDRGPVRLRMSVGMSSGPIDLFKVGGSHEELVVAGPVTTETVRVEAAAEARQVLVSVATASALPSGCLGPPKNGGWLLRRAPASGVVPIVPAGLATDASRFLSVGLRDHLAGSEVHPDHRLATVAFIHALGMDALLAQLDGPAVADRLHETVCTIQDACAEFDVSFLATDLAADGTKVMAAAGAPSAGDDDAGRMLLALTRMTSAGTPLPLRAGANRGHVFAAAVGPWYRKTYTTMGDVTNTAARLMAKAEPGEILVRAEVLDRSRVRFDAEELPPFAAKGKAEPLVPHRVVGPSAEPPPPTGTRLPLRGRDAELDELKALAGDARRGHGALVELVGDMGAGKSRLLDELLALVGDVRALSAHCEPYHRASPFHAVRVLLDQVLPRGVDRLEVLRGTVADRTPDLTPWVPLLAAVLDLDSPETDETRALEARFRLERTAVATVSLLRALLPDPAVLVVEDVHWLDDASAAVLRQLEEGAGAAPWLVVVTRRDEPAPFVPGRGESTSLRLTALADEHMKALVDLATGDAPLPPHERDILVTRAAGNPLYLTALLDSGGGAETLPPTLEEVMAAQIDRLPPADRLLLRHAAVLGSRFDLELLTELAEDPSVATTGARATSARLQWLCVPDGRGRLRFRHQLIRDVAYESLPFRERRRLHARAGAAIERRSVLDEHAGILSLHFLHAGQHDKCWRYAQIAAGRACEKWANVEAVELLQRALAVAARVPGLSDPEVGEAWHILAERQSMLGALDAAKRSYRQARRYNRSQPARLARMCLKEARVAKREGRGSATERWLRRGLREVEGVDDHAAAAVRADLLIFLAQCKELSGRPAAARRLAELGIEEARRSSNRRALASAYMVLNGVDVALGQEPDPDLAAMALSIYEELGQLADLAVALNNFGTDAYVQGRWREARALYERARDASTRAGDVIDAGYGTLNVAEIMIDQGELDGAETLLDSVVPLFRSVDHGLGLAFEQSHRARVLALREQPDEAIDHFERARTVLLASGFDPYVVEIDARIAECRARVGQLDVAADVAAEVIARDRALGGTRATAIARRVLAIVHFGRGDLAAAGGELSESRRHAAAIRSPFDVALAIEGQVDVAAASGVQPSADDIAERDRIFVALGVVAAPPWRATLATAAR